MKKSWPYRGIPGGWNSICKILEYGESMTSLQNKKEASALRVSWESRRMVEQDFGEVARSEIIPGRRVMVLSFSLSFIKNHKKPQKS